MNKRMQVSLDEAKRIGDCLYINWEQVDLDEFRRGLMGNVRPRARANGVGADYKGVLLSGQAVLAHMQEIPDYVIRLAKLRAEVRRYRQQGPEDVEGIKTRTDGPPQQFD